MSRTLLIISDSQADKVCLYELLQADYHVIETDKVSEAIRLLYEKSRIFSAVLLDVSIGDSDGFAALKKIKDNAVLMTIPVLAISAAGDLDTHDMAISCGADGLLDRPFRKLPLLHQLKNLIKLRETAAMVTATLRDRLTKLYNRDAFVKESQRMIRRQRSGCYLLACFNIENFKLINQQYGDAAGDGVLLHTAGVLRDLVESCGGLAGRYASDRFMALIPAAVKDTADFQACLDSLCHPDCISQSIHVRVGRYLVENTSLPMTTMLDRAFMAEVSIKGKYGVNTADYTESMFRQMLHEQKIVNDMAEALKNGEFEPWFQPQYNHATGALIGAEALVRWRKDGQLLYPTEYIAIFERTGFIYQMDRYIWRQVCTHLRRWMDEGKTPPPVSVNISRFDVYQRDFVEDLSALMDEFELPIDMLRLEITESAFSRSADELVAIVNRLINLGFTVEIDDFGSGYSSLNTLKDVPASILKLDMRFFENSPNSQRGGSIVDSVVRMARWLGMAVIAEGVEDRAQADYLKSIGCYYIQGYFYAQPMPLEEYEALMEVSGKESKLTSMEALETLDRNEFWNPKSIETLIFNSYVGGACIFEYHDGKAELLRRNDQYEKELNGLLRPGAQLLDSSMIALMDEENTNTLLEAVRTADETDREASCEVKLSHGSQTEYVRVTVRVIARTWGRLLCYAVILNMTAQREAERKQAESARQLDVIMRNIGGGVSASVMENGRANYYFTNDRFYELLGYTREQFALECPNGMIDCLYPEDREQAVKGYSALGSGKGTATNDFRVVKRDGSVIWLHADGTLCRFGEDGVMANLAVYTDITQMKETEKREHETANRFAAIMRSVNGGVSAVDISEDGTSRFVFTNENYYDLYGYTREEATAAGLDVMACILPEDFDSVMEKVRKLKSDGIPTVIDYRVRKKDGSIAYLRVNASLMSTEDYGDVIISVIVDVTEKRLLEEQFKAVVDNIFGGVTATVVRNGKPEVLLSNDMYYKMLGFDSLEEWNSASEDKFFCVHPEDRKWVRRQWMSSDGGKQQYVMEYRIIRPDGELRYVQNSIRVMHMLGIEEPVHLSVILDVTESVLAQQKERETAGQLRFLSDTAREILTQTDTKKAVDLTLSSILRYFEAERAYIFELDPGGSSASNTYAQCADGVDLEQERLRTTPFSTLEHWISVLDRDDYIAIPDIAAIGEGGASMREMLQAQGIHSLIIVPLRRDGVLTGFLGIDNPGRAVEQVSQLAAIADYLTVLLNRRELMEKIRSDSESILMLMNDTPGGFVRLRMTGDGVFVPVYANDGFARMLNSDHETLMSIFGKNVLDGVHPDDRETMRLAGVRMLTLGISESARFRMMNGRGEYIWLEYNARVAHDDGETFLNVYYTDVSKQVSEEQARIALLDNLPNGAALYRYDGEKLSVIHINRSYWRLVGREPVDPKSINAFDPVEPSELPIIKQEIDAAIRQKRNAELRLHIRYGSSGYRSFRATGSITDSGDGAYLLYVSYTPVSTDTMSVQELFPVAMSTMMAASGNISYVKDADGLYLCCSELTAEILGLESSRDIIGKNDADLFGEEVGGVLMARDREVMRTGVPVLGQIGESQRPGGVMVVRTDTYPIRDGSGKSVGTYGVGLDITAQRENESQLELLTRSVPGGLATYNIDENGVHLLYCNEDYHAALGYTREEYDALAGKDALANVLEEDRRKLLALVGLFAQVTPGENIDGRTDKVVYRCFTKSGQIRWMMVKTVLSARSGGRYVLHIFRTDITEQQEEKERLRQSEELNRLAIEQSAKVIARFDVSGRTLSLPTSIPKRYMDIHLLRNVPEEQIADGRISPETAENYRRMFGEIVSGKSSGSGVYQQLSSDGWRWLEAKYTTVFSSENEPVSAVISFDDITEQREKEVVYNKWLQGLAGRDEGSYCLFRCNLNKDSGYDVAAGNLLDYATEIKGSREKSFDQYSEGFANKYVAAEDREAYLRFVDLNSLLANYHRGRRSGSMDFRRLDSDGQARWTRLDVELVEYPDSTEVAAYLMYEDIHEAKQAELETRQRAERDPLTGLFNRSAFEERVNCAIAESKADGMGALFLLDMDGFKQINDHYGHSVGDRVLTEAGALIRSVLRDCDLVGRLGGDEFVVFLGGMPDRDSIARRAGRLVAVIRDDLNIAGRVTLSLGVAVAPEDGSSFGSLYLKADKALYYIKEHGKADYAFYSDEMQDTVLSGTAAETLL